VLFGVGNMRAVVFHNGTAADTGHRDCKDGWQTSHRRQRQQNVVRLRILDAKGCSVVALR
jgi:hypothetical protein